MKDQMRGGGMKQVVLIGDSIRLGYQATAASRLADVAEVWGPAQNGGNSRNVVAHLDEWVVSRSPDLVHINCGLHDLRREFGSQVPAVPFEEYSANLRTIFARISDSTSTRIVWATTTPVHEQRHHDRKGFDRFENDVRRYNQGALQCAHEYGLAVDDLFSAVVDRGRDTMVTEDGVHYGEDGYRVLGERVAAALRPFLV